MAPLGFPMTVVGSLGDLGGVVLAEMGEVCFWEWKQIDGCYLMPKAIGTVTDLTNDIWDLETIEGVAGHYKLEDPQGSVTSSCHWFHKPGLGVLPEKCIG